MTKNRAHKRAARAIAADQNIRYPEAVALADDKVEHSAPARPQELDMDDLQLARSAAELNSTDLVLAPGVIGSMGTEKMYRLIREAHGTGEAATDQEPDPMTSSTDGPADTTPLQIFTGRPGIYRTARGWSQIEAADAALNTLGIPPAAQQFATFPDGLFLITGATGSGKTMTGAALLRRAHYEKGHMAVAVMLDCEMGFVSDSGAELYLAEDWRDTASRIRQAVEAGARIIFVDDLRESTAVEAALDAALGGVLVFATMHSKASDAAQRLLDAFPDSGNKKIRAKVQLALRGVIEQVLVRGESGMGRVLASEVWAESDSDGDLAPVLTFQESLDALVSEGTVLQPDADKAAARRW